MGDASRVIADLRELARRTSTPEGAQRVAWGPVWREARAWFQAEVEALGLSVETDAAGNRWVRLAGASPKSVVIGSHLDSVPNGGWLDGCLGVVAALEVLRSYAGTTPPVSIVAVDWADEEGARFGRSLFGSAAACGTLDLADVRALRDRKGVALVDALRENGVELERVLDAEAYLQGLDVAAYLELHIEQGPVLEALGRSTGVVLGTVGVERHKLRFVGQAAHSGSTPISMRRDAFLAAAEAALRFRDIANAHARPGGGVVCTVGVVDVEPRIVTAVPGVCEISLDQRALHADVLAALLRDAKAAAAEAAARNDVSVEWTPLLRIDPRPFDPALLALCSAAVNAETGHAPTLPSGPLHDAAEMARLYPTVMMFAVSARGLSHCKEEDTPEPALAETIRAFFRLVRSTVGHVAG